jgi:uncharacterized RDD family membrane protein YckC
MVDTSRVLHIASWDDRFFAWLIDVLLISAIIATFGVGTGILSMLTERISYTAPVISANGVSAFLYWTVMEGYQGQSAGKMVMDIAVTDERGDPIGYGAAAIESFGKAFLLPLDVLVGALAYEKEGLRLFNKLSGTIVVETDEATEGQPEGVEYVYPSER